MATVCFGRVVGDAGFSRTVAIKRLHPHLVKDPEFSAMFLDEARLAARVRHPGVVSTLDVVSTGDELLLVMEYVPGQSIAALARAGSPRLPPAIAVALVSGVLHGLHAAHEARGENGLPLEIVHRDVSPHNILVGEDGAARLIDFGIARAVGRSQSTRDGQLRGKLRYLAPEQLRGAAATRRTDVYAAAVVLWEALTGEHLFDGDSEGAIYGRVLEGVVRPPSALVAPATILPPSLDGVVLRGLARDPMARYATALEMAEALEGALVPASAREVAAWLQRTAGPVLAQRARRVREIERGAGDDAVDREVPQPGEGTLTGNPRVAGPVDDAGAPPAATLTTAVAPPRPRAWRALLAAGAGLSLVLGLALGARATVVPAVPTARLGLVAATRQASLRVSQVTPPVPAPALTAPPPPPVPALRKSAATVPARVPSACDPPYYLDATGIRRVKRECL